MLSPIFATDMPGWKKILAAVLLLAFTANVLGQGLMILEYYFNTKAYAKKCENKYRPQLHCNGKCQLARQLKQQEKNEQQNPERKLVNKIEINSSHCFFAIGLSDVSSFCSRCIPLADKNPVDRSLPFFHPPGS
jgi:hypothetical protein